MKLKVLFIASLLCFSAYFVVAARVTLNRLFGTPPVNWLKLVSKQKKFQLPSLRSHTLLKWVSPQCV